MFRVAIAEKVIRTYDISFFIRKKPEMIKKILSSLLRLCFSSVGLFSLETDVLVLVSSERESPHAAARCYATIERSWHFLFSVSVLLFDELGRCFGFRSFFV